MLGFDDARVFSWVGDLEHPAAVAVARQVKVVVVFAVESPRPTANPEEGLRQLGGTLLGNGVGGRDLVALVDRHAAKLIPASDRIADRPREDGGHSQPESDWRTRKPSASLGMTSNPDESPNIGRARRYLAAIEAGATGDSLAAFFASNVEQIEFPNRLVPAGARRDLAALLDGAIRGQQVLRGQRYQIDRAFAHGETVVLEVVWIGTLAIPIGSIPAGGDMRAHFAVFLEFENGRIVRQRNYDCFDAF